MRTEAAPASSLQRRDRLIVFLLLLTVAASAWAFTLHQAILMEEMDADMWRSMDMSMNAMEPSWTAIDAALIFVMWSMMMAAMMLPGAAPMIAAFSTINRRRKERKAPYVPTAVFLSGYIVAWAGFSVVATALQRMLQERGLLTTMMQSTSHYWSAALFLAAGLYQFSPLKETCLAYCRSPEGFILTEWRDGLPGSAIMGFRHGLLCMGCCAALMVLLFAVAVMELRWIAALTAIVTAEKLLPLANFWRMAIGFALIASGLVYAIAGSAGP